MRDTKDWAGLALGRNAYLALGWHQGRGLAAGRLSLGDNMDDELRSRANATLEEIGGRTVRAYEPSALLEGDEVFLLTVDKLPRRIPHRASGRRQPTTDAIDAVGEAEMSALIPLFNSPAELPLLAADDVRGRSFLFYAAVFEEPDEAPVAFIKRHNAASILKSGRLFGVFGQTVTRLEEPVLVFERDFDLVLDGDEVAALAPDSVPRLFADVEAVAAAVPVYVTALASLKLELPSAVQSAIASACGKRRLLARRLGALVQSPHLGDLTVEMVRVYLKQNGQDPSRFVDGDSINVTEEDVEELLDVLGQLQYLGGYDKILRRADRSSVVARARQAARKPDTDQ